MIIPEGLAPLIISEIRARPVPPNEGLSGRGYVIRNPLDCCTAVIASGAKQSRLKSLMVLLDARGGFAAPR